MSENELEKRVGYLEQQLKELEEMLTKAIKGRKIGFRGICGYKYTSEDIGLETGLSPERLREIAVTGYAPCFISETGDVYFKRDEILDWLAKNLFEHVEGRDFPFRVCVHLDHPVNSAKPVPKEISNISGLHELTDIHFPPCVYFLVRGGRVVYVGQSVGLPARLSQHSNKEYDRVLYLPAPKNELNRLEKELIDLLKPVLNSRNW